jgi:hypothetical protein
MFDMEIDPAIHRFLGDALVFVNQAAEDHLAHFTRSRAGWAGPGRLVE